MRPANALHSHSVDLDTVQPGAQHVLKPFWSCWPRFRELAQASTVLDTAGLSVALIVNGKTEMTEGERDGSKTVSAGLRLVHVLALPCEICAVNRG